MKINKEKKLFPSCYMAKQICTTIWQKCDIHVIAYESIAEFVLDNMLNAFAIPDILHYYSVHFLLHVGVVY